MTLRTRTFLPFIAFLAAACTDGGSAPNKDEYRGLPKTDFTEDVCELFDWYGDGECDLFCANPDPDCPVEDLCCELADQPQCFEGATCCDDGSWSCNDGAGNSTCTAVGDSCTPVDCPDENDPAVRYFGDVETCTAILFACEDGETSFSNECGCGCIADGSDGECCELADQPQCFEGVTCCDDGSWSCNDGAGNSTCSADGDSCPDEGGCCELVDQPQCFEGATCCDDGSWSCNDGAGNSTCVADGQACTP